MYFDFTLRESGMKERFPKLFKYRTNPLTVPTFVFIVLLLPDKVEIHDPRTSSVNSLLQKPLEIR